MHTPSNLSGALEELDTLLSPDDREALRTGEVSPVDIHHTFGRWLRNDWGLWQGSELALWFNARGITHADDMSGIILESYTRKLQGKPLKLDQQIQGYMDWWKARADAKTI